MPTDPADAELAREAKALVALAFRNGPIESVHAGKLCPTCNGAPEYSGITDDEMKAIIKSAVTPGSGTSRKIRARLHAVETTDKMDECSQRIWTKAWTTRFMPSPDS